MRYKTIVEQITTDIRQGKLSHGQRMPSLRKLAALFDVSMTTALNSYRNLEETGWIIARPQSGFFVASPLSVGNKPVQPQFRSKLSVVSPRQSPANTEEDKQLPVPFGISQLSPDVLPTQLFQRSLKRGIQTLGEQIHSYPEPQGLASLRIGLADHFTHYGFPVSAEELVITGGCIDAVRMALEVSTQPGDGVAVSSPCFNGLLELLSIMSRKVVEIPCNSEGIDLEQLEEHIKNGDVVAGLFSSSHMNPQGISLQVAQKQRIAEIANHYRVPIIEDDIYAELGYEKSMPLPIKYWDKSGYVLWCSSVSKTLSAGLRLGWCLPGRYKAEMIRLSQAGHLGHNNVVQAGIADFINTGQYQKHLNQVRPRLFANICAYRNLLKERLPPDSAISQPNGGMVLWAQVPRLDVKALEHAVLKAGIDIRFGSYFTTRRLYREYFRINAGWALTDAYDEKRTVEQALRQLASIVVESTLDS